MLDWLRRRKGQTSLPEYSAIRTLATRGLPKDLLDKEKSESIADQCELVKHSLREPGRSPQAETPLFIELLAGNGRGVLTIPLPEDGGHCLLVFSSPIRAADYVRTLVSSSLSVNYLSSSPLELVGMLRDLRGIGIKKFALDRCPRCNIFAVIGSESVTTAENAITCWSVANAAKISRLNLYLNYACESARAGHLDVARHVALKTVAHVSMEDPRVHLLVGQIAVALRDRRVVIEAKAFLRFLNASALEHKLEDAIHSGSPAFNCDIEDSFGTVGPRRPDMC